MQLHAPFAQGPRLLCACAPDEQHELGLLMFALLMEQRGWEVVYLGQSLEAEGSEGFLKRLAPALVCVTNSMVDHMAGMLELCRMIASLSTYRLQLVYSGAVFEKYPEFQARVPGIYLGIDLRVAANRAEQLADLVATDRWYNTVGMQPRM